ncbi:rRNA maturation RNase YbeY [Adlercreutzia sp. ZJ304]|uniref:rRNA maturation RNase YbeY n=1 Tax=Adlercreutzia sp. ZJ304 TaxID=2709791 RepID=UPI0013ED9404|nr:rRNA maturation RNase YbeY [Adlercreutzia sp. ZJ304]
MDILVAFDYRKEDLEDMPIQQLAQYIIAEEQKPFTTEVSITFVDNETMAKLNSQYRGKSGPTDVLSFECDSVEDDLSATLLPQNPVYELGDVVIAVDVAEAQSSEFGQTFQQEIELLLVHGLLHLCGYDHIVDDEAEIMEAREDELLKRWRNEICK